MTEHWRLKKFPNNVITRTRQITEDVWCNRSPHEKEISRRVADILLLSLIAFLINEVLHEIPQNHLRYLEKMHQLDQTAEYHLRFIFEHVGNYKYGAYMLPLIVGLIDVLLLVRGKLPRSVAVGARIAAVIGLSAVLLQTNHDTEHGQESFFSFGKPHELDVPAGVFGAGAGGITLGMYALRARRRNIQRVRPLHWAAVPRKNTARQGM